MRIVFADPLKELQELLKEAAAAEGVSHVAISSVEMKACVTHLYASQVFPNFVDERTAKLAHYDKMLRTVRLKLNGNMLNEAERNSLFDRQNELERAIEAAKIEVPSVLTAFNGIIVKTSLKA